MAKLIKMPRANEVADYGTKGSQGYRHIDKDPIIDFVISKINEDPRSITAIAKAAYISPTTLMNWDKGKTRKPQHATVFFVMRELGWEERWVKMNSKT